MKRNVAILGAAGRDYHCFLMKYKDNKNYDVKFFTQNQIPGISKRSFPKSLAGKLYKKNIPFYPEEQLPKLIHKYQIDDVVLAYSDLSHVKVMHKASIALANGANFILLGPEDTMIESNKPIVAICAVRTGSGKSPTSRKVAEILRKRKNTRIVAIRHPMPYGDLKKQAVQKFSNYKDLKKHKVTIEEREEYEPWIEMGIPIYAGVDYKKILKQAEKEADIIIWDGGNNDLPFYFPDLHIVVMDPFRPCHELLYHPGEANFRMADVLVINKISTAPHKGIKEVLKNIKEINPKAKVIKAKSKLIIDKPKLLRNRRVLVIEDGPTLTHGELGIGAGYIAAKTHGAKIVDPRKYAIGSIKEIFKKHKQVTMVLPAMGYSKKQIKELETSINRTKCDVVVDGTPVKLDRIIHINKPIVEVNYVLEEKGLSLKDVLKKIK